MNKDDEKALRIGRMLLAVPATQRDDVCCSIGSVIFRDQEHIKMLKKTGAPAPLYERSLPAHQAVLAVLEACDADG